MAHGTRGRWLRVATTGFGVLLCTGLVGCMNSDKSKGKIGTKQPGPGLPGTPTLPAAGAGSMTKSGQFAGPGANLQPGGAYAPGAGAGQTRFGSNGLNSNTTGSVLPTDYEATPGGSTNFAAPAVPGAVVPSVLPAAGTSQYAPGAPVGYAPGSPQPPSLVDMPLPPGPPLYSSTGDAGYANAGSAGVLPPAPIAPPLTPPGAIPARGQEGW